jgi:hypothetical protein
MLDALFVKPSVKDKHGKLSITREKSLAMTAACAAACMKPMTSVMIGSVVVEMRRPKPMMETTLVA